MDKFGDVEAVLARYPESMRGVFRPAAGVAARVVGMAEGDAKEVAGESGVTVRTIDADNPIALTMELVPDRVTFWVRGGVVTKVEIG